MTDLIRLLPDSIANQIAAGEVVQRPASVVKELLENSLDAGATQVKLIVKDAGKTLIQVIDNGAGMSETDARMSFERHATSKIRSSDDLFRIRTMGFRGEALASIAAVAQVELRTRRPDDELGTCLRIEASEVKAQEPVSTPVGTSLCVKNLFFNVPARRNFLKSNPVEMRHVIDEFQRVALARPDVGFSLHHNDSEVYSLPAEKLSRRIVDLFGKSYREQLASCQEETPFVNVRGYIGRPEFAKKVRGEQFFFVNYRYIRHNYLHHAVLSAFEGLIPENSHPFYVLFIDIDPVHIDINVHPTKTEIKFDDERSVYAIVRAAVKRATGVYSMAPSLDFDSDINASFLTPGAVVPGASIPGIGLPQVGPVPERKSIPSAPKVPEKAPLQRSNLTNWSRLFEGMESQMPERNRFLHAQEEASGEAVSAPSQANVWPEPPSGWTASPEESSVKNLTFQSKANQLSVAGNAPEALPEALPAPFQLHNRYILSQVKSGVLLIDQRAAYERILYDKFEARLEARLETQAEVRTGGGSQALLFPRTIELSPADAVLVGELAEEIRALGFEFSEIGRNAILIQGLPADLAEEDEHALFAGLLEQYKLHQSDLRIDKRTVLARSLARRTATRYTQRLNGEEMTTLINQLFASTNPRYTPSGEPTMALLSLDKLAGLLRN